MAVKMVDVCISLNHYLPMILTLCAIATFGSTEQHVVGWLGQDVRLLCNFTNEDVLAVYWMNGSDITKASYFKQQRISLDDRFALNEDFSLVINDLEVSDEGRYVCHVEFYSAESLTMHTILAVYAQVSTPRIGQCSHKPTGNEFQSYCEVTTTDTQPFHLDCRVTGFRPNVSLEWTSSGTVKKPLGEPFQKTLPDGTADRVVTISVTAKVDEDRSYTCTVKGRATNGTDRTATITVLALGQGVSTWAKIGFGVLGGSMLIALILPVIAVALYRLGHLRALRKEIRTYTFKKPGKENEKAAAHIGLFGEMGAGKSTFLNSIEFAYKGKRSQPTRSTAHSTGGHTELRNCLRLTDYISLFDNRGMKDFSLSYVDQYMDEIRGKKEEAGSSVSTCLISEEIYCAVFVYKHGLSTDDSHYSRQQLVDRNQERFERELQILLRRSVVL
ncbi:uncharacterized protein LOC100890756 isoform X2 [Strongylocentrotus purpuratus]|uniref:Ig-like domain-containing protein n=1 Tax=Strongylocentrotus purpuratus TaxID=7668 RepID=A0A7M7NYX2_STRPU|nr:uncharacterized protein LOC100890756 isoform X2 [Strongylocentrotus purpuratus]